MTNKIAPSDYLALCGIINELHKVTGSRGLEAIAAMDDLILPHETRNKLETLLLDLFLELDKKLIDGTQRILWDTVHVDESDEYIMRYRQGESVNQILMDYRINELTT